MEKYEPRKDVVLLVEDEYLIRADTADILADEGFAVLEAPDAEEALGMLAGGTEVAVLFTDVNLPGMSGLQLARKVAERWPHIRVLVTSGHVHPAADEFPGQFIGKPYMPQAVVATVRGLLAG